MRLRPAEAVALPESDLVLPATEWGRIDLAGSQSRAGRAWTDTGQAGTPAAVGESNGIPPIRTD
jgi:hypothetical protein